MRNKKYSSGIERLVRQRYIEASTVDIRYFLKISFILHDQLVNLAHGNNEVSARPPGSAICPELLRLSPKTIKLEQGEEVAIA